MNNNGMAIGFNDTTFLSDGLGKFSRGLDVSVWILFVAGSQWIGDL